MGHAVHRVTSFVLRQGYSIEMTFSDGISREIDFRPVLEGELYGPLQDLTLFRQVRLDPEVHTLVWPNGADFDPAILHDWPDYALPFANMARQWARTGTNGQ